MNSGKIFLSLLLVRNTPTSPDDHSYRWQRYLFLSTVKSSTNQKARSRSTGEDRIGDHERIVHGHGQNRSVVSRHVRERPSASSPSNDLLTGRRSHGVGQFHANPVDHCGTVSRPRTSARGNGVVAAKVRLCAFADDGCVSTAHHGGEVGISARWGNAVVAAPPAVVRLLPQYATTEWRLLHCVLTFVRMTTQEASRGWTALTAMTRYRNDPIRGTAVATG